MPVRSRRAMRQRRATCENTATPSPYAVALAQRDGLVHVAHLGDGDGRAERLLAHRRRVLGYVDQHGRLDEPVARPRRGRRRTARPPRASASSMWRRMMSSCAGMVIGPNWRPASAPTRTSARLAGQLGRRTRRTPARRRRPARCRRRSGRRWSIAPHTAASAAASRSASSATISASLPPPSMSTGVRVSAQAAMTFLPVAVEPVKRACRRRRGTARRRSRRAR